MTRPWNLAESRLIAERVMEWQVTEQNGRLFLVDPDQRPDWLETCAVPDWPNDPAAAAMALAAMQMDGWIVQRQFWTAATHTFLVRVWHPYKREQAEGVSASYAEAVMLAVLAGVRG